MSADRPERVMVIGIDGPIVPRLRKYIDEGVMPAHKALIESGVFARNCLVPYPTITPPNWTTIVTGAWPGTHGITGFHVHKPGDPLDKILPAFDSRENQAEFLWEAIDRAGKRSIILNYPSTWPPRGPEGLIQVAGAGLAPNEWRRYEGIEAMSDVRNDLCGSQLFATEEYPRAAVVTPRPAKGWRNAPKGADLEVELPLGFRQALVPMEPVTWWGLLVKVDERYRRLILAREKDASQAICELEIGQWSEKLCGQFKTAKGQREGAFKLKLLKLSSDGHDLKLFLSPICALDGYHQPAEIASELAKLAPMPLPIFGIEELTLEWIDDETWTEIMTEAHQFLAQAVSTLLAGNPWDLFCMHLHCPDWAYHAMATPLDPVTQPDATIRQRFKKLERGFHRAQDDMLATIMQRADDKTLVIIVSDHGAKATGRQMPINQVLADAGLLAFEQTPTGPAAVDWGRTEAVAQRSCYIYVNLKGRDPQGIVAPENYDEVRDRIIQALYDHTDPETGKKPISFALRREDARVLGLYGDGIGDVVFGFRHDYAGQHGNLLPTAKWGLGSVEGLLIMKGPGIREGEELERTVWLTDVVPTICHLTEWPLPAQTEGAVIYQALTDRDAKYRELGQVRKNYERLKRAEQTETALTHTYHQPQTRDQAGQ
ncbi:MAG TPA: alkaline phosphatase family protein [Anaerolineae bacterium]|nr:alkaline phosphatase family protein [Anaerolineae bacterium]